VTEAAIDWAAAARAELARKTMPRGALGRLEGAAVALAVAQRTLAPRLSRVRALVFAADHGVAHDGVSAYPREVTRQMMATLAGGRAAAGVLARATGIELEVIDVGVDADRHWDGVVDARVARGTANLRHGPAMDASQCSAALAAGAAAAARASTHDAIVLGEIGIGNSTAAAALLAALSGRPAAECTGAGSGVEGPALARKVALVAEAVARVGVGRTARELLAELGGFEIAAMTGAALFAAARGQTVLVDGFIAGVAALCAVRIDPPCRERLVFTHRSAEHGHRVVLAELAAEPLLEADLRLGEGTGAMLAVPLLRAAAAVLRDMASFDDAGVSDRR
jgi:nicotinate-nucleotide--dimethylbenzimidazole phosphoribosyltransferase